MGIDSFFCSVRRFCKLLCHFPFGQSVIDTNKKLFVVLMPVIDGFILAYLIAPLVNATERNITTPLFEFFKIGHKKGPKRFLSIIITEVFVLWDNICFFLNCNSSDF